MTPLPHTIGVDQCIANASRRMSQLGVRHLPVLAGGELQGVVSERDILFLRSVTGIDPERTIVEDAMSPEPFVVGPEMPLGAVARNMAKRRIGSAVVVEGKEVIGILTTTDTLAVLADVIDAAGAVREPRSLPSEVRERVLEEHGAIRGLLATAASLAERVLDLDDEGDTELPEHARELYQTLIRHLDLEDLILAPALRAADAWGPARAEGLAKEHREQRRLFAEALRDLETGGVVALAKSIQDFVPAFLADMEREEKELLSEELLTDSARALASES